MGLRGTENEVMLADLGQRGTTLLSGTTARTGTWFKVVMCQASTFTLLTDATRTGGDALDSGDSFAAGVVLHGQFTAITLKTGLAVAYKE